MTLRFKLAAMVASFVAALAAFVAVVTLTTSERVEDSDYAKVIEVKDLVADVLPPPAYLLEAYMLTLRIGTERDPALLAKLAASLHDQRKAYEARHAYWGDTLTSPDLKQALLVSAHQPAVQFFEVAERELVPVIGDPVKALAVVQTKLAPLYEAQRAAVDVVVEIANREATHRIDEAGTAIHHRKMLFVVTAAACCVLVTLIGWVIAAGITRRSRSLVRVLDRVANRDFTCRQEVDSKDEMGKMGTALNAVVASVQAALTEVRTVSEGVATAAQELASASEDISSGAQHQAASLEETAASLEEITATIKQNADNARQANQIALSSREMAEKGGQVVNETIVAMSEINAASNKISDIITAIDEIAFQTNLLALNAAVEAARAGEQGRGFSVVATEVRNLAGRSATAAKEIKALIQDSLRKVETGSALVSQSGTTLQSIITSVKRVTDIVGEMTAAAREQSAGVDQVNTAVTQMDQVTQSSAAQTEELSATAQALTGQADQLQVLVRRFHLDGEQPAVTPEAAPAIATRPTPRPMVRPSGRPSRLAARKQVRAARGSSPGGHLEAHAFDVPALAGGDDAMDEFMRGAGESKFEEV